MTIKASCWQRFAAGSRRAVSGIWLNAVGVWFAAALLACVAREAVAQSAPGLSQTGANVAPVRIVQEAPRLPSQPTNGVLRAREVDALGSSPYPPGAAEEVFRPREPDAFERFATGIARSGIIGTRQEIRRFGVDILSTLMAREADAAESLPIVPDDYVVKPGDGVRVSIWGSVDADLSLTVDRSGRLTLPRIGSVLVAGVRYSALEDVLRREVSRTFRNFDLSVSMSDLRGIRVFVTGFVERPGVFSVNSLSTLSQALFRSGGPSSAGSFRRIEVRRPGRPAMDFDLYDLLIRGDRKGDIVLQADDVIHVSPVGKQVAIIGSVNVPAVFELKPGETIDALLSMAGGLTPVADPRRLLLQRLGDRDMTQVVELGLPEGARLEPVQGDVLVVLSVVESKLSQTLSNRRIIVEGEVARPGNYLLPAGSTVADAIHAAGGLTANAFLFGAELRRESVRMAQVTNYERALRDVESDFTRAAATQRVDSAEDVAGQAARLTAVARLVERLRSVKPDGRVVLEVDFEARDLPPLALEDFDRLYVPARPSTVGVFGSVFSVGNYLHDGQRTLGDYLSLAGGPTRGADRKSIFVVRANGRVMSEQQASGWFVSSSIWDAPAFPGDTIFVPEEMDKTTWLQGFKDWTQILYQLGLGVAAFKSLNN